MSVTVLYLSKMDELEVLLEKKQEIWKNEQPKQLQEKLKLLIEIEELLIEIRLIELELLK